MPRLAPLWLAGRFEFTVRRVDTLTGGIEWAAGWGSNGVVVVSEPSSLPAAASSAPSAPPSPDVCPVPRSVLARSLVRFYRLALMRLGAIRPLPHDSNFLAAYTLALLGAELHTRGESAAVIATLFDMCLRLGGPASWLGVRSSLVKLLRRWLGDSGAQRAVWACWGAAPVGLDSEASSRRAPGGMWASRHASAHSSSTASFASLSLHTSRSSWHCGREELPDGSLAELRGPSGARAPILGAPSRGYARVPQDTPSGSGDACAAFASEPPTLHVRAAGAAVSPGHDQLPEGAATGESPLDGARSGSRLLHSQQALTALLEMALALEPPAGRQSCADGDGGSDELPPRLLLQPHPLAPPAVVDQVLLELLLALIRSGGWALVPASFVDALLQLTQAPAHDLTQRAWLSQLLVALYMPSQPPSSLVLDPAAPLELPPSASQWSSPTKSDGGNVGGATTSYSTARGTPPLAADDPLLQLRLSSPVLMTRRAVVHATATGLLRQVRQLSLQLSTAVPMEVELPASASACGASSTPTTTGAAGAGGASDSVEVAAGVDDVGGRALDAADGAGSVTTQCMLGYGSAPRSPERHRGLLPSATVAVATTPGFQVRRRDDRAAGGTTAQFGASRFRRHEPPSPLAAGERPTTVQSAVGSAAEGPGLVVAASQSARAPSIVRCGDGGFGSGGSPSATPRRASHSHSSSSHATFSLATAAPAPGSVSPRPADAHESVQRARASSHAAAARAALVSSGSLGSSAVRDSVFGEPTASTPRREWGAAGLTRERLAQPPISVSPAQWRSLVGLTSGAQGLATRGQIVPKGPAVPTAPVVRSTMGERDTPSLVTAVAPVVSAAAASAPSPTASVKELAAFIAHIVKEFPADAYGPMSALRALRTAASEPRPLISADAHLGSSTADVHRGIVVSPRAVPSLSPLPLQCTSAFRRATPGLTPAPELLPQRRPAWPPLPQDGDVPRFAFLPLGGAPRNSSPQPTPSDAATPCGGDASLPSVSRRLHMVMQPPTTAVSTELSGDPPQLPASDVGSSASPGPASVAMVQLGGPLSPFVVASPKAIRLTPLLGCKSPVLHSSPSSPIDVSLNARSLGAPADPPPGSLCPLASAVAGLGAPPEGAPLPVSIELSLRVPARSDDGVGSPCGAGQQQPAVPSPSAFALRSRARVPPLHISSPAPTPPPPLLAPAAQPVLPSAGSMTASPTAAAPLEELLRARDEAAPQPAGPARLVMALAHALLRLSPATYGDYEAVVRAASSACAADEGVARYVVTRLLDAWPRSDSEKEKLLLGLLCGSLPWWSSGAPRQGGSCMDVDAPECGARAEAAGPLLRRVVARVCMAVQSPHTAVANEAVMHCLPRSLPSSRGRTNPSPFGQFALTDPAALMAVARALEANVGVVRRPRPRPALVTAPLPAHDPPPALVRGLPADAMLLPKELPTLAAAQCVIPRHQPQPPPQQSQERSGAGDRGGAGGPSSSDDAPAARGARTGGGRARSVELADRPAARRRSSSVALPGLAHVSAAVGTTGGGAAAAAGDHAPLPSAGVPQLLLASLPAASGQLRRDSLASVDSFESEDSASTSSTPSSRGGRSSGCGGERDKASSAAAWWVEHAQMGGGAAPPRTRNVATTAAPPEVARLGSASASFARAGSVGCIPHAAPQPPGAHPPLRRAFSGGSSAMLGGLGGSESSPLQAPASGSRSSTASPSTSRSGRLRRRVVRQLVLASLALSDSVIMALEAASAKPPPGDAAAAPGAPGGGGLARVPPVLAAAARPLAATTTTNSTTRPQRAAPLGHWSPTIRFNSVVVLQAVDRAMKERLAQVQMEVQPRINMGAMADKLRRRLARLLPVPAVPHGGILPPDVVGDAAASRRGASPSAAVTTPAAVTVPT